jgi:hypothetical protein
VNAHPIFKGQRMRNLWQRLAHVCRANTGGLISDGEAAMFNELRDGR